MPDVTANPSIPGSLVEVETHDGRTLYEWTKSITSYNFVLGTRDITAELDYAPGSTEILGLRPGTSSHSLNSLRLEHWFVSFPISTPYWRPVGDYTVEFSKVTSVVMTRGSGNVDSIPGTVLELLTQEIGVYDRGDEWIFSGGNIVWQMTSPDLPDLPEPKPRPTTGSTYTIEIVESDTLVFDFADAQMENDLGLTSFRVDRIYTDDHEYTLNDDVTVFAKRIRPLNVIVTSGKYVFHGTCRRLLDEGDDFTITGGNLNLVEPLVLGSEVRVDYNFFNRPSLD